MKAKRIQVKEWQFLAPLANYRDMPEKIWCKGQLPECAEGRPKVVSIVGSRKNTNYGESVAYKMAYDLAKAGVVIVSGLAYGIDAAAHRGCLDAGGITVAVLGTTIDRIYPRRNVQLAERILERGAILSEYSLESEWGTWDFVRRNRLVSGLADAVIIAEAALKSGSLTTATWALEQGKELFAVPGDITRPMSVGCNKVIKQGAHVLTEMEDVLGILFPGKARQLEFPVFGDNKTENDILGAMREGLTDGEMVMGRLKLAAADFNQAVTMLEIKGAIRALGGNKWCLA